MGSPLRYGPRLQDFDVNEDKLSEPPFTAFGETIARLSHEIYDHRQKLAELVLAVETGRGFEGAAEMLGPSEELTDLADLEAEMNAISDDFADSALAAVHFIVKKNVASLNLYNLYGDGGDKFMVGGLFVRRAKNWRVCGKLLSED